MSKNPTGLAAPLDDVETLPAGQGDITRRTVIAAFAAIGGGVAINGATVLAAIREDFVATSGSRHSGGSGLVENHVLDQANIRDYGAIGDGTFHRVTEWIIPGIRGRFSDLAGLQVEYPFVTSLNWSIDRAAIQRAHNAAKNVDYPSGRYHLGNNATGESFIDLSNAGHGISVRTGNAVELICNTTANVVPAFFYMFNNTGFRCGHIRFRDTGYSSLVDWRGAAGFQFDTNKTATGNWGDIYIESIYAKNCVHTAYFTGGDASHRISDIRIGAIYSDDCYYGFNCQNQGDGIEIGKIVAVQNIRPYLIYGCSDHVVKIFNRNNRSTSGAINISRLADGLDTKGIDITYVAREQAMSITHVLINHIGLLGGEISNIRIHLDIQTPRVVYSPIRFVNYSGAGGTETNRRSVNRVSDIEISGSCDIQALPISVNASYADKRPLIFKAGRNMKLDASVSAKFSLSNAGA